jgi:hypothetical protein
MGGCINSTAFTPGPWHADADTRPGWEWNWHIMEGPDSPNRVCFMANTSPDMEKAEANARLIAAAPDMFEALESLNAHWNGEGDYDNSPDDEERLQQKVTAALAKARGDTQSISGECDAER